MIRTLLKLRFRALFAGLTAQNAKRKKPMSPGLIILYVFLFLYLIGAACAMMGFAFSNLAPVYHAVGLDWLYFSVAGLIALSLSVIGSVFTTQSQLYDAKDNALLMAMPIPPRAILLSRMIPLLSVNLLFSGVIMVPAIVVYAVTVEFSLVGLLLQLLCLVCISLLAQAIANLLGWLLHLLLRKVNPSIASVLYMVVFLGLYFYIYSQAETLLQALALNGQQLANALQSWVWPLYAMGQASIGSGAEVLAFAAICAAAFGLVYWLLSVTFLRTAATTQKGGKVRKLSHFSRDSRTPLSALRQKELRKFLGCPVYLTNMGVGLFMLAAVPIASIFLRSTLMPVFLFIGKQFTPLILCGFLAFLSATCSISTPSVSLEGKSLWLLKSMPLSGSQILHGKLQLHLMLTLPVCVFSGAVTAIVFGCTILEVLLCGLITGLLAVTNGLLGMWSGLKWAKFDYISEAYPCKQSVSVVISIFGTMGIAVFLGLLCWLLFDLLPPAGLLGVCALLLAVGCAGLYKVMVTWGVKKWDNLQA